MFRIQQLRMFNQLDSHDTARFKTLLGRDIARLPLAVVWLFTWPGVPCIYYGDEVGLDGKNDPFCRKPFPWQVNNQTTASGRRAISRPSSVLNRAVSWLSS
ncbi:alpha-amylase family glycosyl hydrolase [Escherichia coli]|uniref:alpha-amylase family glycosyl hydrolase n=1 Tax=Escherichia coli TaxID=562 RepID=UPI003D80AE3D